MDFWKLFMVMFAVHEAIKIVMMQDIIDMYKFYEDHKDESDVSKRFTEKFKDQIFVKKSYSDAGKFSKDEYKGRVNLNTATYVDLRQVPGITVKIAERIVEYRKDKKFKKVSDLRRIRGIGYKYRRFEKYLYVD